MTERFSFVCAAKLVVIDYEYKDGVLHVYREARNLKYWEEKGEKAEELKLRQQQQKLLKESEEAAKIAAANRSVLSVIVVLSFSLA